MLKLEHDVDIIDFLNFNRSDPAITINRIDRHHRVVHLREFLHLVVVHIQRPQTCSCSSSVCLSVIV